MPLELRKRIAEDVRAAAMSDPAIAAKLAATGQVIDIRGPEEFAAGIKELDDKLAAIAKVLGMKAAR
jgi:tripartite-type tricarboxylate transporter receptor subunit TctC